MADSQNNVSPESLLGIKEGMILLWMPKIVLRMQIHPRDTPLFPVHFLEICIERDDIDAKDLRYGAKHIQTQHGLQTWYGKNEITSHNCSISIEVQSCKSLLASISDDASSTLKASMWEAFTKKWWAVSVGNSGRILTRDSHDTCPRCSNRFSLSRIYKISIEITIIWDMQSTVWLFIKQRSMYICFIWAQWSYSVHTVFLLFVRPYNIRIEIQAENAQQGCKPPLCQTYNEVCLLS